ncbi:MAG: hypothetical protein HW380_1635 [Magnetococcales bacterium]|nr:hypothetical protein [Magnetococcales bacterium]
MSDFAEVIVLVEGLTEHRFVKQLLAPYMADRGVYLTPIILDKPGEKGGDVKFARAINDIEKHLKQRRDTWLTLLIDYYGIKQHVDAILAECKEPEKINDHSTTAPSKRLEALSDRFKKTSTGLAIATEIGISKMRFACPLFDAWLTKLESLVGSKDGEA